MITLIIQNWDMARQCNVQINRLSPNILKRILGPCAHAVLDPAPCTYKRSCPSCQCGSRQHPVLDWNPPDLSIVDCRFSSSVPLASVRPHHLIQSSYILLAFNTIHVGTTCVCLFGCLSTCLLACLSLSACLPACMPACLPDCLHSCLPAGLPACLPACLPAGFGCLQDSAA